MFEREKYTPPMIYFVNANSKVDIIDQCVPFIEDLADLDHTDNDIEIIVYHDEKGHPSRIFTEEAYPLIKKVLERKIYRYYNRSDYPDKKIQVLNRELSEINNEKKKLKIENTKLKNRLDVYESRKSVKIKNEFKKIIKKILKK